MKVMWLWRHGQCVWDNEVGLESMIGICGSLLNGLSLAELVNISSVRGYPLD